MGKTYRRKDLKVRDYDYFGKRKAPDGVSHKDMVENIFRSDKWRRMKGIDSEVKDELNHQLRGEVRKLKNQFTLTMILITILLNELLSVNQTSAIVIAEENMNIKRMLFKQGLYTLNVAPKGDTTKWSVNDWIKFIDENGNWKI